MKFIDGFFTFNKNSKLISIKKYIFFSLVDELEVSFQNAALNHQSEISSGGEYMWTLRLNGNNRLFTLMYNLFESPILKKKEKLQNFIAV